MVHWLPHKQENEDGSGWWGIWGCECQLRSPTGHRVTTPLIHVSYQRPPWCSGQPSGYLQMIASCTVPSVTLVTTQLSKQPDLRQLESCTKIWGMWVSAKKCYVMSINKSSHVYQLDSHILKQVPENPLSWHSNFQTPEMGIPYK